MNRRQVVELARTHIGTKWQHQGRAVGRALDCVGLLVVVGREADLTDYDFINYGRRPDGTMLRHFRDVLVPKRVRGILPGDVAVFAGGVSPCHCGIIARRRGRLTVIHAHQSIGKVIEEDLEQARDTIGPPTHLFAYPGING